MRPLNRGLTFVLCAVLLAASSGCSLNDLPIDQTVTKHLDVVTKAISKDSTLLIQDVSPRVGKAATFRDSDDGAEWTIVGSCADAATVEAASTVEVAVIPTSAFTKEVEIEFSEGKFDSSVACDGREYR